MRAALVVAVFLASSLDSALYAQPKAVEERKLFDFENDDDVKAWSDLVLPDPKRKEPAVKWERSADHATSGKHSLKITFDGGSWPTITTTSIPDDWSTYHSFKADVWVERPCLIGFQALQEKSTREAGWDGSISRWVKTVLAQPGKNEVSAALRPYDYGAINKKFGKVVRFEIFMYNPRPGESIYVDNIRLSTAKDETKPAKQQFKVLGTDWTVSGVQELGKKLEKDWKAPVAKTVDQLEEEFRALHTELKRKHPGAVLAIFRDGENGYDPANPDKVFSGWKDAYWSSHGPDGMTLDRAENFGKHASQEIFMRHRSPLTRVELDSIPKGSNILAAKLVIVRATKEYDKERDPRKMPNMWVAEACNRPWDEYEVNAYQFAKDKFWKAVGGMHWTGDDPDFLPLYLAYAPGGGAVSAWDFTQAVKFWTDGKHPNHGFMLHSDAKDWLGRAHYREAKEVRNRPALMVIYEVGK
jgi:hypothetical protein